MAVLDKENGTTPARRAISCSPSCQCMASAARHGMAISSATLDHISALNLEIQCELGPLCATSLGFILLPFIQPSQFVFLIFIPLASSFQIILIMKSATDRTAAR